MNTIDLDTSNPNSTYNKYLRRGHSFVKEAIRIDARNNQYKEENLYLTIQVHFYYEIADKWYRKASALLDDNEIYPDMTRENPLGNFKQPKYEDFYNENNQLKPEFEGLYDDKDRAWDPSLVRSLLKKYI